MKCIETPLKCVVKYSFYLISLLSLMVKYEASTCRCYLLLTSVLLLFATDVT